MGLTYVYICITCLRNTDTQRLCFVVCRIYLIETDHVQEAA